MKRCNAKANYLSMTGGAYCPKHCPPGADPWPALEKRKPCDYVTESRAEFWARHNKSKPA